MPVAPAPTATRCGSWPPGPLRRRAHGGRLAGARALMPPLVVPGQPLRPRPHRRRRRHRGHARSAKATASWWRSTTGVAPRHRWPSTPTWPPAPRPAPASLATRRPGQLVTDVTMESDEPPHPARTGDPLYAHGVGWVVFVVVAVKVLVAFAVLMGAVTMMIWFERKVISDMQSRIGPNRAGPSACSRRWPTASSSSSRRTWSRTRPTGSSSSWRPTCRSSRRCHLHHRPRRRRSSPSTATPSSSRSPTRPSASCSCSPCPASPSTA